jgi:mannose-6-phosphate isomerase
MTALLPFQLDTQYRQRVWGGQQLKQAQPPIGEAWIIYEENLVSGGENAGRPLASLVADEGARLLGKRVVAHTGGRFPLLIKLLDCADWLSVQVHPDDEQAKRLEGPGQFGKTEAWHILAAESGARLIAGVKPGTVRD